MEGKNRLIIIFYAILLAVVVSFMYFLFEVNSQEEVPKVTHKTEVLEVNEKEYVEPEAVEEEPEEVVEEEAPVEEVYYEEPVQEPSNEPSYNFYTGPLNPTSGVYYYNGRKETYYSSRVLYHYRTPEWTAGYDGVYRDSEGYVVVAASDLSQGSLVDTSFGMGKVYDSGCAAGTTDIYVIW